MEFSQAKSGFGVSMMRNKAAVRSLPTDFFGYAYCERKTNLRAMTVADCLQAHAERLSERRALIGF